MRSFTAIFFMMMLFQCIAICNASEGGPWDLKTLRKIPKFTLIERKGNLCSLYYEGEPYKGKPTRIFAYLAYPEGVEGKAPAVVLVHGGAGKAYPEWAELWASRGYVALAMDHYGQGPDVKPMPDGGPGGDTVFTAEAANEGWTYSAVAAVIRGVSLIGSLPEVDPKRIGMTGISWGGYLTCIVAGLDDRIKAAAPIYGCGFLHEASIWLPDMQGLSERQKSVWKESHDPSCYLPHAKMPMLFVNGTNDGCFWLNSYQKSYRLVKNRTVCILGDMLHSQVHGAAPIEINIFMDQYLKGGKALPKLSQPKLEGNLLEARMKSPVPIVNAELHYTTDTGVWKERKWQTREAKIDGDNIKVELPTERPIVYYISVLDSRQATVTTEHDTLTK